MTKEIRLEGILIRFDENGKIKGAAAYDFEQIRDDATNEIIPIGQLPARPLNIKDVRGLIDKKSLETLNNNITLQSEIQNLEDLIEKKNTEIDFHIQEVKKLRKDD